MSLLEKFRCHLNCGDKTSADFLRENYQEYIVDVRAALSPEDNQLVGAEMCKMVSEQLNVIEENSNMLLEVLKLYSIAIYKYVLQWYNYKIMNMFLLVGM